MAKEIIVFITTPSLKDSRKIASALVSERLAACVNMIPGLESTFFWKGKICRERENLMVVKSTETRFSQVAKRVKQLHPYTVPEIIALPIVKGSKAYLKWVNEMTR